MIEAGAKEVSDDDMFNAIMLAHAVIKQLLVFIDHIVEEVGKPKFTYESGELDHDMFDEIFAYVEDDVKAALDTDDKNVRDERMEPIQDKVMNAFRRSIPISRPYIPELIYKIQKKIVRRWLLDRQKAC